MNAIALELVLVLKHQLKFIFAFTKNSFFSILDFIDKKITGFEPEGRKNACSGTFRLQNDSC